MQEILIIGLGNPGSEYGFTRHNIGFILVDKLLMQWHGPQFKEKWNGLYAQTSLGETKIHLLKPMTYMNRSGTSVADYCRFYKLSADNMVVIHDDLDMAPGRVKLVKGGGAGGHKGILSIVQHLGTKEFFRLKVGIGRPGKGEVHKDFPVEKYVLSEFSQEELQLLQVRQAEIEAGIEHIIAGDTARAKGVLNSLK